MTPIADTGQDPSILSAEDVSRAYSRRSHIFGPMVRVQALHHVNIDIRRNETLGVVGESGSGKTTLTRLLLGLERPDAGTVRFHGFPLEGLGRTEGTHYRKAIGAVFQNPYGSLDPRMRIRDIVVEQLALTRTGSRAERSKRANELLELVGLSIDMADRFPRQLSGGQRQRVAIARALASNPEAIILDEPISALDVSVRAQVINLLLDLQEQLGLAYIFVAHDLAIVRHMCHRVVVLYRGDVVEQGPADRVLATPAHPYTVALLQASYLKEISGAPDPNEHGKATVLMRKVIENSPSEGCRYRLRCPQATAVCEVQAPSLAAIGPNQEVACHNPVKSSEGGLIP